MSIHFQYALARVERGIEREAIRASIILTGGEGGGSSYAGLFRGNGAEEAMCNHYKMEVIVCGV